jgi:hypothetical protein
VRKRSDRPSLVALSSFIRRVPPLCKLAWRESAESEPPSGPPSRPPPTWKSSHDFSDLRAQAPGSVATGTLKSASSRPPTASDKLLCCQGQPRQWNHCLDMRDTNELMHFAADQFPRMRLLHTCRSEATGALRSRSAAGISSARLLIRLCSTSGGPSRT